MDVKRLLNTCGCASKISLLTGYSLHRFNLTSRALIAQLVERVTSNDEVAGSTPS